MKKIFLFSLFLLLSTSSLFAQAIVTRLEGRRFVNESNNIVEGSPYLYPDYAKGSFLLHDDKTIVNDLQIKYNILNGTLIYKDANGEEMVSNDPIKRFTIEKNGKISTFQLGFPPIDDWTSSTYYQVLNVGGPSYILKKPTKTLSSNREYNSAKTTDTYLDGVKYYLFTKKGEMVKFKTDKKSLASYFADQADKMADYIAKNKPNLKNDEDLAKLFDYYNSLK